MVRFDQPCRRANRAVEYFREHLVVGDYLTAAGKAEMTWVGSGAARLGLAGRCQWEHFKKLCQGRHPVTGEKLMVRDNGARRRICFLGQISLPKDVSVLHLVGGDERIGPWWQEAVAETLKEAEALTATRVRRGGQNSDRRTGEMVAAVVTHDASRALDPQLHTHVCILNHTFDGSEERWKSVEPSGFYRHQGYLREVCFNQLAAKMTAAGYELEPSQRSGFAVKGFPAALREVFSKRRRAILREAAATGTYSQNGLQAIAVRTRADKTNATAVSLRAGWLNEAGEHLDTLRAVVAGAAGSPVNPSWVTPAEALRSAEAQVFERKAVVDDRLLLREALVAGRGRVTLDALKRALVSRARTGDLVRVDEEIASRDALDAEREFTGWAHGQLKTRKRWGLAPARRELGADQAAAVQGVLGSTSGVVILRGDAGTGQTTCLQRVVAGIEQAGGRVFGCAPSSGAADVLRRELTAEAAPLPQLLANESLQRATQGRVLIVDKAGLVSVRQMRDLCRLAARNDHRLLLVGDRQPPTSSEAGDAIRCLQEFARVPVFHLTELRRPRDRAYRQAVARLARGDAFGAFNEFTRLGAVRELPAGGALWNEAAADYVRTVQAGKSCLAISPVRDEIHEFTAAVRAQLRAAGVLSGHDHSVATVESRQWTQADRRRVENYRPGDVLTFPRTRGPFRKFDTVAVVRPEGRQLVLRATDGRELRIDPRRASGFEVGSTHEISVAVGDRLLIRANVQPANLRNGDLVEIAGIDHPGEISLKDGRVLPAWFRGFTHGYATTSHAAQGKTVDRGLLLMADAGIAAGNLKQTYVANSRFRESQMIYTSDRAAARDALMRTADRKRALEVVGAEQVENPAPRRSWRARWAPRVAPTLSLKAA